MRRSKSNTSKYARNYRSISQRQMTEFDDLDEDQEMERLRCMLRNTEHEIGGANKQNIGNRKSDTNESNLNTEALDWLPLSGEMKEEIASLGVDGIVLPPKKKKQKRQTVVELSPEELRQAKIQHKKLTRKLKKLSDRAAQRSRRAVLYSELKHHAISKEEAKLLSASSTLGKKNTKRERLTKLLRKERAGIKLCEQDRNTLCTEKAIETEETGDLKEIEKNHLESATEEASKTQNRSTTAQQDLNCEKADNDQPDADEPSAKPSSFASQMMASILEMKARSSKTSAGQPKSSEEKIKIVQDTRQMPTSPYVPTKPAILKTAAALGIEPKHDEHRLQCNRVFSVDRPEEVARKRLDLPVCRMEYEIIDAVRNHDVTIICSDTGSGKSTQVPQFLYEAGFTTGVERDDLLHIGVTQPRRVAAVSTAKRISFEMGSGDGQTIKGAANSAGNLVAYQTRYEKAGMGSDTRIKFMTDGILMQEIQSDLLLRKYGVVVLDEAHERNLNTDVLIGLLSVALPLRKKASEEERSSVTPLKIVLMSASLRVADFTENETLFPSPLRMHVVKVPGRTFPVTIHHSKVTELDDYENAAFKKVCKIHRRLPPGGILVFLTGKQEIIRMVRRLNAAFDGCARGSRKKESAEGTNVPVLACSARDDFPAGAYRDMDDDEFDGDLLYSGREDYGDDDEQEESPHHVRDYTPELDGGDNQAKGVVVLPLYSMLSTEEQAKVFSPVLNGHRLIVVATNIGETSLTIPGITYVVDTGRQKCRNHNSGTGAASYDVMWISKASADQRAGRAGRTAPGHCYRLYSSSMYSRHMDSFALPEVLTRPLEDVVLAMKAMHLENVAKFPFPTPPDRKQIDAAVKMLANIGCLDISETETTNTDGRITRLGAAVTRLPLGVRYGKMMLVAAQAGILEYGVAMVAVLSEPRPFLAGSHTSDSKQVTIGSMNTDDFREAKRVEKLQRWMHKGGDVLAGIHAAGAYAYVGGNAGDASEKLACMKFCEENGLNHVIMARIHRMRKHLTRLAKARLSTSKVLASDRAATLCELPPPSKGQEILLMQAVASGFLDNVAVLATPGSFPDDQPRSLRSSYLSCSSMMSEPLLVDKNSVVYSRDSRTMPEWVCYDSVLRTTRNDGTSVLTMKTVTPIDPSWLGSLSQGSRLLSFGVPIASPSPVYDEKKDAIMCCTSTKFGVHGWDIPPVRVEMFDALQSEEAKRHSKFLVDDSFRWFARFLLEGKVFRGLKGLPGMLNDSPGIITRRAAIGKSALLVSALSSAGVDSAAALRKHWAETDEHFLSQHVFRWVKPERLAEARLIWVRTVEESVAAWKLGTKSPKYNKKEIDI